MTEKVANALYITSASLNDLQVRAGHPQGESILVEPNLNVWNILDLVVQHRVDLKREQFSDADRSYVGTAHRAPDMSFERFSCRLLKSIAENIIFECQDVMMIDVSLYMPPNGR